LTLRADLAWSHAFDILTPSQNVALATGPGFAVLGAPLATDAAALQLGLDLVLTPEALVTLGYDGSLSNRGQSHAIRGGLNWRIR
jgi:outer membrane autotransporter protein